MENAWDSNPWKNEPLVKFFRSLDSAKSDARSCVLVGNGFLELMVEALIKAHCKNGKKITADSRTYPYSAKLLILNELGVIPDEKFKVMDHLRKIRNDAAHNPFFEVTAKTLHRIKGIPTDHPNPIHFVFFDVVGGLWNSHIAVLSPVFTPSMHAATPD